MSRHGSKSSHRPPLATLLAPAASSPLWNDSDLAALLLHQLQSPLSRPGDPTFGEVLLSPNPDISLLRQIMDYSKNLRDDPDSGIPREIPYVLYYAAIAAAEVKTSEPLTCLDPDSFARGIRWALSLKWLPESLMKLFTEALARQKGNSSTRASSSDGCRN